MMVMRKLRKKMRVFLWFAIIIFVAGMTAMMVGGGGRKPTPTEQGKVGEIYIKPISAWQKIKNLTRKKKIPLLYRDYSNLLEHYKKQGIPDWKCRDLAFNSLVEEVLAIREMGKREIELTDEEVVEIIKNNPPPELLQDTFLMTNGEFDYNKYLAIISDPSNIRWLQSYELLIRSQVPREILFQTITSSVRPTTIDLVEAYAHSHLKLKLEYALIPNPKPQPPNPELLEYYNTHQDEFSTQKEPIINYVVFQVPISAEDEAYTKEIAQEIADFAQEGASLDSLAIEYNCKLIETQSQTLNPKPQTLKKDDGYHIIKEDKELILPIRPSDESFVLTEDKASDFISAAKSDFLSTAKSYDLEVHKVAIHESPLQVDLSYINLAEKDKIIGPIEGYDCFYVLYTLGMQESHTPEFSTLSDKVRDKYHRFRAQELAQKLLDKIKGRLKPSLQPFKEILQSAGFPVETREFSVRAIHESPIQQEIFFKASNLPENETGIVSTEDGIYLVHCLKHENPTQEEIEKAIPEVYPDWMKEEKSIIYEEWLANLKTSVDIKDYRYKIH